MNAKRGVKGLKIALIHPLFSHSTSLVGDEKQEKLSFFDHCLCTFYHVIIRDARSYDYDITKVNRMTWTYVLTTCIPMRQSQETKRL